MKRIYIAAYHQSKFGKLLGMTLPEIVKNAIEGACKQLGTEPAALDVASIGAMCNFSLNKQGVLAGLMAMVPDLEGRPVETVENACTSGGQSVLSVIQKLLLGWCAWQLLGKVPPRLQVKDAKVAATLNIGGPICASVGTMLKPAT